MKTLFVFFFILFGSFVEAATLKIATGEYAPYSGEHLKKQGISSQVVKAVFKEMKQDVVFEFMPWKRVMLHNDNKTVSGSFPWNMNEERLKTNYFSFPIHQYRVLTFTKADTDFHTESSLKGKKICIPDGWDMAPYVKLIHKVELQVVSPVSIESCFNMLMIGRVDIVLMNELVGKEVNLRLFGKKSQIIGSEKPFFQRRVNLHYMISKKYPNAKKLIIGFNRGLEKIRDNGVYDAIVGNAKSTCEFCNQLVSL